MTEEFKKVRPIACGRPRRVSPPPGVQAQKPEEEKLLNELRARLDAVIQRFGPPAPSVSLTAAGQVREEERRRVREALHALAQGTRGGRAACV